MTTQKEPVVAPVAELPKSFPYSEEPFAATHAAQRWIREQGWSLGRMQAGSPRGLIFEPGIDIQKWRNLDPDHRAELNAVLTGEGRHGPVIISLQEPQPAIKDPGHG